MIEKFTQYAGRNGLFLPLLACLLYGVVIEVQAGDQLRLTICDTAGDCCAGGQSFMVDDAWIDPETGDLNVEGSVFCAPGWPQITEFSVNPSPVSVGEDFSVEWLAEDASECVATGDYPTWAGPKGTSGSEVHTAGGKARAYTLVLFCSNSKGQDIKTADLTVTE